MKRKHYSVEQIVATLKQAELDMTVAHLFGNWDVGADVLPIVEAVHGTGIEPSWLKQLQDENERRKKLIAHLSLDKAILQETATRNGRAGAEEAGDELHHGSLRFSDAAGLPAGQAARSTGYYRSVKYPQTALRQCMCEIAQTRVRYGYRRVHVLLERKGWRVSRSRVYRLTPKSNCAAQASQAGGVAQ